MKKLLYKDITEKITEHIKSSHLQPGDKLPSYRASAALFNISANTISKCTGAVHYRGVAGIRPQFGVFVQKETWNALKPGAFNWQKYLHKSKDLKFGLMKRFSDAKRQFTQSKYVMSNVGLLPELYGVIIQYYERKLNCS